MQSRLSVPAAEISFHLSEYLDDALAGRTVAIDRGGRIVAYLVGAPLMSQDEVEFVE